uniref:Uncharacterized protein AlNc14C34G3096 n=1 Tax=Albugo laibachii Nc14 TaxID=890382 RepID=F0W8G6_9STRA|nr:conserved hypothetical protein [Albugo laibachii Nc14]|eukprot:CCA17421.1 conserved hypothetical protein [Albugo laibachii Nc14]
MCARFSEIRRVRVRIANNGNIFVYARTSTVSSATIPSQSTEFFSSRFFIVKVISELINDPVSCISISPCEKNLIVGTSLGTVHGLQLSDHQKVGEKLAFTHDFHAGAPITCIIWDELRNRLFSASKKGSVCQTTLRGGLTAYFGAAQTELLVEEESGIVQLEFCRAGSLEFLLVSSLHRMLVLNLDALEGNAVQIGTKSRNGMFGGCFTQDTKDVSDISGLKVLCARPGRRIWIGNPISGKVAATLKFPNCDESSCFHGHSISEANS